MDIKSDNENTQSISDDQELAKVLAGVNQPGDDSSQAADDSPIMPEPPTPMPMPAPEAPASPAGDFEPTDRPAELSNAPSSVPSDLDSIKQEALGELRPLVDKLNVSPEEKFDTYLLLLRSTDDRDLIAPAHQAAKEITDEARKAQALLDIIKEIDFLSQNQQTQQ